MQVVDVDMNRDESCPGTWHKITTPRRLCLGYVVGCVSAHFQVMGVDYENVCGQAKTYQKGSPDAYLSNKQSIDGVYVDGISITLGSPRKHVWTYVVGLSDDHAYRNDNCPCATHPGLPPPCGAILTTTINFKMFIVSHLVLIRFGISKKNWSKKS